MIKQHLFKKTFWLPISLIIVAVMYNACSGDSFWKIEPEAGFVITWQTPDEQAGPPPCSVTFTNTTNTRGLLTTYVWTVNDSQIQLKQDASYTFNSAGTFNVKLTATNRNASHSTENTVIIPEPEVKVVSITIAPEEDVLLEVGQATTLTATVLPANAANKSITWSSLNADVATVTAQTGTVTGVKPGTATIRAAANDGSGVAANRDVVVMLVPELNVSPTSYHFPANGGTSSEITVTSNLTWTVSHIASWLTTSRSSGNNTNTFTMTATATGISSRSATVTVTSGSITKTISVTQEGRFSEPEMVFVQGGTYKMGCTGEQGNDCYVEETPAHNVTLSSFYIGKYEVTQAQWQAIMGRNPSNFKGDNLPVESVSWNDIVGTNGNSTVLNGIRYYENGFIYKLNAATGKKYRLPTEAEWEYAARGGNQSRGYKYSGSNAIDNVAWYWNNSGDTTHPVGTKQANELGIYDMCGNVWEWCQDWYGSYSSSAQTNPQGSSSGSFRVFRGGSFYEGARSCRVSHRDYDFPGIYDIAVGEFPGYICDDLGFRVALSQ